MFVDACISIFSFEIPQKTDLCAFTSTLKQITYITNASISRNQNPAGGISRQLLLFKDQNLTNQPNSSGQGGI
jgi:hypothetical protein